MAARNDAIDPITLEVLRHRLWMINDEQGRVAAQLSGSPVVYESKDFNTSLMTPDGESLYIGIYTTRLSLCLNFAVKTVIERFSDGLGYGEGDAFVTNDPWCGAAHQNDFIMVAPIFWQGALVCWTGLAMHEIDVGGPNPGGFTVGTTDVFGEPPLIPPIKMVEGGRIREDVEALVIRNSRTTLLNGLNMRARLAAINRTRQRIAEVIEDYGLDAFLATQRSIMDLTRNAFARRLRGLPDGTWREEIFLDHDGNTNTLYRLCVAVTKKDDRLTFDFTGTDKQARGSVNCTRVGLESGVLSAVLPSLCFDMPWSPGGLMPQIDIISEPGTLNNAIHPAAVSMATVAGTFATTHVTFATLGKMLACSDLREESQASWCPAWQGVTMAGHYEDKRPFTAVLLDKVGGAGAFSYRDGPDSFGLPGSPSTAIANIESYEQIYPILYVYRRHTPDTSGAGKWRGGAGMEVMIAPHRNDGPIDMTVMTHGASQPTSYGLLGGYPGSVQVRLMLRGSDVRERLARGEIASGFDDGHCRELEPLAAKTRTLMQPDDVVVIACSGGGGYGDALDRPAEMVAADVARGAVSARVAHDIYGVVLTPANGAGPQVDGAATKARRAVILAERLSEGRPVEGLASAGGNGSADKANGAVERLRIGDALAVVEERGRRFFACPHCGRRHGPVEVDPRATALMRDIPMRRLSEWNRFGLEDAIRVREYFCPSCAHMIAVEVRKKDDPMTFDIVLAAGGDQPGVSSERQR